MKILSNLADKILNMQTSSRIISIFVSLVCNQSKFLNRNELQRAILFCIIFAISAKYPRDCHPLVNKFAQGVARKVERETFYNVNFSTVKTRSFRILEISLSRLRHKQINKTCLIAPSHPPV